MTIWKLKLNVFINMTIIGHITDSSDGIYYVDKNGSAIELAAQGWNHFKGE